MPRPTLPLSAVVLAVLLAAGPAPAQTPDPGPVTGPAMGAVAGAQSTHFPDDADLLDMLRYLVEDGATRGVVLGVLEADGSTRVLSYGDAGEGARPLGPRSVFEIGSINKTFTGALLADMVARGEVALSDPVERYLPDGVAVPSWNGLEITLLDLATHHSGLPRMVDNHAPADPADPYADYTTDTLYAFLAGHELRRAPGAEGEYSNLGFGLLGHALARAAGTTYEALVRERVLDPLGMDMTGYALDGGVAEWTTRGHGEDGDAVPYWFATEAMQGAGGLRSNVEDMLTYLRANVGPAETDLERAMRDARGPRRDREDGWSIGLGWQVYDAGGRHVVSHGGGTGGYRTSIGFVPEEGVGFVLLANSRAFEDDLGLDFLRRGRPLDLPEVDVDRGTLAAYAGRYELAPGRHAVVGLEDEGHLTVRVPGNVRFRMYAESDTSFYLKRTPWRVRFTRDAAGAPDGMVLTVGGEDRPRAPKLADDVPGPVAPAEGVPAEDEVRDLPLAADGAALYEGTYGLPLGDLRVYAEGGALMADLAGAGTSRLLHQGAHTFVAEVDPDYRFVFTAADGPASGVTLHVDGREVRGERKR